MGTVADKLTYLNGTKSSLKTAINNLGGSIDNNTTFRQYATELNTIYDNLPKVSDTGTNVSLNPTLKGRLGIVPKGNTYQESTTGKNLLNVPSEYSVTGFVSLSNSLKAGTYYVSCGNVTKGGNNNPAMVIESGPTVYLENNMSSQITLNNDITSILFYSNGYNYSASQGVTSIVENLMISTSGGDYEPYTNGASPNPDYPQEIQSATGTQKVVVSGKNLFDKDNITNNYYYDASGNYIAVNETYISDYIEANTNESYTLQTALASTTKRVNYFDSNKNWLSQVNTGNANYTFTTPNNTKYIRISFNLAVNKDNIQLEQGTATPYQPYQEPQEVDIELSSRNLVDIESDTKTINNYYYDNTSLGFTITEDMVDKKMSFSFDIEISNLTSSATVMYGSIGYGDNSFATNWGQTSYSNISAGKYNLKIENRTITSAMVGKKLYARFLGFNQQSTATYTATNIQLEYGTTATDYVPYYNYTPNKIGDYEDYIDGTPDNWVLYKNIGKVVLDKTLSSVGTTNFSNVYQIYANVLNISYLMGGYCDNFKFNNDKRITDNNSANSWLSNNQCALRLGNETARDRFYVKSSNFATANELKEYFNNNPTTLCYVLAIPTETPITEEPLVSQLNELYYLQSYNDTTNIDVTGNLPMRITASAIKGA